MTLVLAWLAPSGLTAWATGEQPPLAVGDVFTGPAAMPSDWLSEARPAADGVLRRLTVEDRVGVRRRGDLVRVPLFFHAGECPNLDHLAVYAVEDTRRSRPLVVQWDDVRPATDGQGVAAAHAYFEVDLEPWQQRQFDLVAGQPAAAATQALPTRREGDRWEVQTETLKVAFSVDGPKAGRIVGLDFGSGIDLPHGQLAPRMVLERQDAELKKLSSHAISYIGDNGVEIHDAQYGAGPLFAKLRVVVGPPGSSDRAEFVFRVPRQGDWFSQAQRLYPAESDVTETVGASMNFLLQGRMLLGDGQDQHVLAVPAGLRREVRAVHGYTTPAIASPSAGISFMPVGVVQLAAPAIDGGGPDGYFSLLGPQTFERKPGSNSDSLRSFWTEVRYVLSEATTEDDLWTTALPHRQPLVAVVDEPWLTPEDLRQRLASLMAEWEPHHSRDWRQEIGRLYTVGDTDALEKRYQRAGRPGEDTEEYWLEGARKAYREISEDGTRTVRQYEKGRASGGLDPWHLTYAASCLVPLTAMAHPNEHADRVARAIGRAQREFNGRVDEFGLPYVDCFGTAFNMQIGSIMLGLHAARRFDEPELAAFYRDVARTPAVLSVYGRGERTYPSLRVDGGPSDVLYQMTSDFYLRMAEIATGEDLWLHPSVHGRYTDMVDVLGDQIQQRRGIEPGTWAGWHRANFMRGQTHDHRWESWSTGPFARVLKQELPGQPVGLTEACYWAEGLKGRSKNWVEITTYFHTDIATREDLAWPEVPPAPPRPTGLEVEHLDSGNRLTWRPVPDAAGYRVYRAERSGGPWTLLNSPYREAAAGLVAGQEFRDPEGTAAAQYRVTAVDGQLRESRWFADEPGRDREVRPTGKP